ncbi:MAG: hypothetical protein ACW99G_02865 [Candidatus Thorarchaeota archaeon]|jgi:hypothetical protein
MAQLSSLKSVIRDTSESGVVGRFAGFGSIFGIIAAALGLISGVSLVPIPSLGWEQTSISPFEWVLGGSAQFPMLMAGFMGLMAVSLLLQVRGSKGLAGKVGGGLTSSAWLGFIFAISIALYAPTQFSSIVDDSQISGYLSVLYLLGTIFVVAWQVVAVIYTDSSKTWVGFLAGMLNALFIPVLALGQVISPLLTYAAYGILLVGQLFALLFWWSPFDTIREYARSPSKAKFAFGLTGVLTFVIGFAAVLIGPLTDSLGVTIWSPWSAMVDPATFQTNPALIYALLAMMIFWIMLAPRLGARELKAAAIGEDIVKGGSKILMLFLVIFGLLAAGMAGTFVEGVGSWGFFLVIAPAGVMFIMGGLYTAKTDIVTGIPLVFAAVILMIHPYTISGLIIYPWLIVIITQFILMLESWWRGFTGFSQPALTVIVSLVASVAIILFMLGGFGSGPLALWPTNRWFNITLIPGIPAAIQSSTIIVLPLFVLLLRNVCLAGYSYGRGYTTGGILMGMSVMFAFMVPVIAGNQTVAHEANTGAALLFALYSISVVLVMSLNLNLANDVEDQGHGFEGSLIKVSTLAGLIAAGAVVVLVLIVFAGIPTPGQIAMMVSLMVTFIVSNELLSILGWFVAGYRLGMLKIPRLSRPQM